jgi:hypothetical protein
MTSEGSSISIWFFIGFSLLINGILILGAGIYEFSHKPEFPVVLFELHAGAWWGGILTLIGALYTWFYRPSQSRG